mmetsp:Transcript_13094/g.36237  ORF Transcript_13094/g.36237 Transcript_13094/m.36237 type:complete len:463 (+) Transcript_13094:2-1390(+)
MEPMAGFITVPGGGRNREAAPTFSFPIMKSSEILICMEELNIALTEEELKEPSRNRDRLKQMWIDVLLCLTGQTEESLEISIVPEESSEEDTILFGDTGDLFLFRALSRLMVIAGYNHFSMRDLYAPNNKRLRHQLSAILNMAKYREEQLKFYSELCEPRKELIEALEEAHVENKQLHQQLEEAKATSQQKDAQLEEIMNECHELELEIAQDNRRQAKVREEANQLKRQANDLKDELTAAEWKLEELEAQEENLRVQVVSSPDRRRNDVEVLRERVLREKKENAGIDSKIQQKKASIVNLKKAERDLSNTTTKLEEIYQSAHKYMKLMRSVDDNKAKRIELEKKARELEQKIEDAERRVHRSNEKILAQRKQHALQREATQEALDTEKSRILVLEKQRREDMLRIQQGEAEVKSLRDAMEAERLKTEKEIEEMLAKYKKHERAFLERDGSRLEALGVSVNEQ